MDTCIPVGVSSCLLGNAVRYNGGHKHCQGLTDIWANYLQLIPVCPEVECGLPVPREPMGLRGDPRHPFLVTLQGDEDHTGPMLQYAQGKAAQLAARGLCGFIFKKGSPSCGLKIKVEATPQNAARYSLGIFAGVVRASFPLLPVAEETGLKHAKGRENFITRVFCYRRWQDFLQDLPNPEKLAVFHDQHRLLLMAHSPEHLAVLNRLLTQETLAKASLLKAYGSSFMHAFTFQATTKKNVHVLQHTMKHLKPLLNNEDQMELLDLLGKYANSLVPLMAPLTLINHYARTYDIRFLKSQMYLQPYPLEQMLRYHP